MFGLGGLLQYKLELPAGVLLIDWETKLISCLARERICDLKQELGQVSLIINNGYLAWYRANGHGARRDREWEGTRVKVSKGVQFR